MHVHRPRMCHPCAQPMQVDQAIRKDSTPATQPRLLAATTTTTTRHDSSFRRRPPPRLGMALAPTADHVDFWTRLQIKLSHIFSIKNFTIFVYLHTHHLLYVSKIFRRPSWSHPYYLYSFVRSPHRQSRLHPIGAQLTLLLSCTVHTALHSFFSLMV